ESNGSRRSAAGKPTDEVGAVLIRTPVVIHDGLCKVITISEGLAGDASNTRVDRIKLGVMLLIGSIQLRSKLASQRRIKPRDLAGGKIISVVGSFVQQAGAFMPGPGS